jgi:asparagine synthase (glutamine-hydrolysing)
MFRASRSDAFLDRSRPHWVDQLLSRTALETTGYFNSDGVLRQRALQMRVPRITPRRAIMDLSLTCVVATQLWHHTFLGGGLCDLPSWTPTPLREPYGGSLDVPAPIDVAACATRG